MRKGLSESEAGRIGYERSKDRLLSHSAAKKSAALEKFKKADLRCERCQKEIPFDQRRNKFCSQTCSAITNNEKRMKKYAGRKCLVCESGLSDRRGTRGYCSSTCFQKEVWKAKLERIEAEGRVTSGTEARRYLTDKFGYRCIGLNGMPCNVSEWHGRELVLILDHIDGNADNWSLTNIRLLCPNCNSQTPTFTGRNIGKGRKWRRDKYKKISDM